MNFLKISLSLLFFTFFTTTIFAQTQEIRIYDSCLVGKEIKELRDIIDNSQVAILYLGVNPQSRKEKREFKKQRIYSTDVAERSVKDNRLNLSYIRKIYTLNKKEKEELYKILTTKTANKDKFHVAMCYNPNHAIVFLNSDGQVQLKVDLCFECLHGEYLPTDFPLNNFCRETWDNLEKFILEKNPGSK
jgi:ferredoxin-like protein FixX